MFWHIRQQMPFINEYHHLYNRITIQHGISRGRLHKRKSGHYLERVRWKEREDVNLHWGPEETSASTDTFNRPLAVIIFPYISISSGIYNFFHSYEVLYHVYNHENVLWTDITSPKSWFMLTYTCLDIFSILMDKDILTYRSHVL